ncbi:MAG: hypothetical protein ACSLFI_13710 [Solirubrobacterales bacterium]
MGLSEDSRTLLQLLLGRGKSYSDIAGLLGIDEAEVRDRAHTALTEINGSDPDKDLNLTDYLLGQSDPIARADAARELAENPKAADAASDLSDQLRLLVPGADLPRIQGGKVTPSKRGPQAKASSGGASGSTSARPPRSLTGSQRRLIAILLGAALLVTVVILALTGVFGGSDDSNENAGDVSPTTAVLTAVDGQSGEGQVQFGFSGTDLAANLQFSDLAPTAKSKSYALWLNGSAGAFPIHQTSVNDEGAISGQITINQAVICFIAADIFPDMRLSLVDNAAMEEVLAQATRASRQGEGALPDYIGKTVLEGRISMPQAAKEEILPTCSAAAPS